MLSAERITEQMNLPELPVYVFAELDSTSSECRRRLGAGERQCLVLAERQTMGRGRSDKAFFSPAGGLYMSLAMQMPPDVTGLTCRAAVEAAEAIEREVGISCGIKWVNDLFYQGKKVCGILTEAVGNGVILGIGINLTPTALPPELDGIAGFLCCGDVRESLAAALAVRLMSDRERAAYMEEYRRRSVVLGKTVRCKSGGRETVATVLEIDDEGGLVVLGPSGRETLHFGEVSLCGIGDK